MKILNKELINTLLLKLCAAVGLEETENPQTETETETQTELAETTAETAEAPAPEEPKEPTELEILKAENEQLKAELESVKAELEALKGDKAATETENTQLKEKLSAAENAPADAKLNLSVNTPNLAPKSRGEQALEDARRNRKK